MAYACCEFQSRCLACEAQIRTTDASAEAVRSVSDNRVDLPFRDGKLCASGSVIRLVQRANTGGVASYPNPGDVAIHQRGNIPAVGASRYYQVWFRNPGSPCGSGSNLSNGLAVVWTP